MSKDAETGWLAHLSSLWTLIRRGDGETQLAEDIRECLDGCWDDMDSEEQSRCRRASSEQGVDFAMAVGLVGMKSITKLEIRSDDPDDLPEWVGRNKHKKPRWDNEVQNSPPPIEPRDVCVCEHHADQHKWLNDPAPLRSRHLRCTACDCGHFRERGT